MLAVPGSLPAHEGGWGVGGEFDGVRLFTEIADGRVTLHSRNANDVTAAHPELQALAGDQIRAVAKETPRSCGG